MFSLRAFCVFAIGAFALDAQAQEVAVPPWTSIATDNVEVEQFLRKLSGKQSEQALRKLQQLADADDGDAVFALARAYGSGRGVARSDAESHRLLEQGFELQHPETVLALANIAETKGKDDALYLYSLAAELGQPLANLRLAKCNEEGHFGLSRNPALAIRFYRKAQEAGVSRATYELGRCYRDGVGVSPDAITSTRLFRRAAEAGISPAQLAMGEAYAKGRGIAQDNVAAVGWLMLAAQNGNRDAMVQLGTRYENGVGVVQDYRQAGTYYDAAAKQGDQVALYRMAMLFVDGRGTKQDRVRGYVLLHRVRDLPPAAKALRELDGILTKEQLAEAKRQIARVKK